MAFGDTRIITVGGSELENPGFQGQLAVHVRELHRLGHRVIVVHGGDRQIANLHRSLGLPTKKSLGLRVTSPASMELVIMVLCGLINKRLVALFASHEIFTLGVCGADLGILESDLLNLERLGRVGGPPRVGRDRLELLMERASVLVLAPVCLGSDGQLVNISAELAAQAIAVSLNATSLEFVVDEPELQTVHSSQLGQSELEGLLRTAASGSRLIPKLQAGLTALDGGVSSVRIGSLKRLEDGTALEVHP
jgi:acetylglutamate kinase